MFLFYNSLIEWGAWSFTLEYGENLTPEDGLITVQVSITVPDQENTEFIAYLRIDNKDNPQDFDIVPVNIITQKNTALSFKFLVLQLLSERFPHAYLLLSHILHY